MNVWNEWVVIVMGCYEYMLTDRQTDDVNILLTYLKVITDLFVIKMNICTFIYKILNFLKSHEILQSHTK